MPEPENQRATEEVVVDEKSGMIVYSSGPIQAVGVDIGLSTSIQRTY